MKFLIALLMLTNLVYAAEDNSIESVIRCLGQEEFKIHKMKLGGAVFELNQRLISDLIMFNKIQVLPEIKKTICKTNEKSHDVFGSVRLLEFLIEKEQQSFIIPKTLNPMDKEFYKSSINEFVDLIPEIFLNYIAQVQASSARSSCLEDHIPELKTLNRDLKALEQDIPARKIINRNQMASKILIKLRTVDKIYATCDAEVKKKEEEEKKKALKKQ